MILEQPNTLKDYEFLDSGEGQRLERFGQYILVRPDPQAIWKKVLPESDWLKADAIFQKQEEEKGNWKIVNKTMKDKWLMQYPFNNTNISFYAKLNPFKHTGVFPEQSANWDFIVEQTKKSNKKLKFLNLFGYTGIASVLAAKLGYEVTHLDASKPSLSAAKENMLASGLPEDSIRWILDDALKFVKREVKRGNKYDCIILDPPAFGRGAKGEVWKFNEDLPVLLDNLKEICSEDFKFIIINAYAVSVSSILLKNLLEDLGKDFKEKRKIDYGELVLEQNTNPKRMLSTGIFGRIYLP